MDERNGGNETNHIDQHISDLREWTNASVREGSPPSNERLITHLPQRIIFDDANIIVEHRRLFVQIRQSELIKIIRE